MVIKTLTPNNPKKKVLTPKFVKDSNCTVNQCSLSFNVLGKNGIPNHLRTGFYEISLRPCFLISNCSWMYWKSGSTEKANYDHHLVR
ncbi:hypothetical protein G9P44_005471 [Scheffersomyces stipitis]|nr:hypothetical protein G9P44_005471 [Scheffersomyces stipitis]